MKFISLCSGIEAASVAFEPLGWEAIAFSEIDPFCSNLLAHHYPDTPNLGDLSKINWSDWLGKTDLVIGGTPCQSFSLAGLRNGLNDDRGQLTLSYVRAIRTLQPRFFIYENVPGILSDKTNAFGCLLAGLLDLDEPLTGGRWNKAGFIVGHRYSLAWKILDSQHFGVPQRRKRVFIIGYRHDGLRDRMGTPAKILFEPEGERRHSQTSSQARESYPRTSQDSVRTFRIGSFYSEGFQSPNPYSGIYETKIAKTLDTRDPSPACNQGGDVICFTAQDFGGDVGNISPTLRKGGEGNSGGAIIPAIAYQQDKWIVRKLLPEECEALQGFPRGYSNVPFKGKPASDTARYKALGNSFAVPVVRWIGERIQETDNYLQNKE